MQCLMRCIWRNDGAIFSHQHGTEGIMQTFEVGKTYTGQGPDGYVCKITVASRTAKTITTTAGARLLIDTRLGNTERVKPDCGNRARQITALSRIGGAK